MEEEQNETPASLKEKQIRMEQQVYRIWTYVPSFVLHLPYLILHSHFYDTDLPITLKRPLRIRRIQRGLHLRHAPSSQ
jgi:hypothetical protein